MVAGYLMADESFSYLTQLGLSEEAVFDMIAEGIAKEYSSDYDLSGIQGEKGSETVNGVAWRTYTAEGPLTENGVTADVRLKVFFRMDEETTAMFVVAGGLPEGAKSAGKQQLAQWLEEIPATLRFE